MGVTSITDLSCEAGWTLDGGRTYTAEVQVETDSPAIGGRAVVDALALFAGMGYRWPLTSTATESDSRCLLQSVKASPSSNDRKQWRVTLEFSPRSWEGQDKGPVDEEGNRDPFQARPTLRARAEEEEVAVTHDRHGDAILNSAGDPFDPPLSIAAPTLVFEISRLERTFNPALITSLQGRVNDSEWMGFPAESILCRSIAANCGWNDDVGGYAWQVDYEFAYREPVESGGEDVLPGWSVRVLDAGLRQLASGDRKAIMVDNAPVSSPVPLKSDGTAAGPSDDPHYMAWDIYPEGDFSGLDFPADMFTIASPEPAPEDPEDPEGP